MPRTFSGQVARRSHGRAGWRRSPATGHQVLVHGPATSAADTVSTHCADRPAGLRPADLRPADLRPAYFGPAFLRPAYLRPAYLRAANATSQALSRCCLPYFFA